MTYFFTFRQRVVNCYKIDNGFLCWPTAEFLDAYLEPLLEELVARHIFIRMSKSNPATRLKAEELGYSRKRLSQVSTS